MHVHKTFTFIDESGVLNPTKTGAAYFGVGAFKHTNPISFLEKAHPNFEALCSALKKDKTQVEFHFKNTTASSIKYDLQLFEILKSDYDWEFNCLYFDANDGKFSKPKTAVKRWEMYVTLVKMLVSRNLWSVEETIVIADYQRRPKASPKKFDFVTIDIRQVYNVLQTESHGVIPIQIADMLLGEYLYSLNPNVGDKEGNKTAIAKAVADLQSTVGKKKFNCWAVDWNKAKQQDERV
jgi:hypothetical protein